MGPKSGSTVPTLTAPTQQQQCTNLRGMVDRQADMCYIYPGLHSSSSGSGSPPDAAWFPTLALLNGCTVAAAAAAAVSIEP